MEQHKQHLPAPIYDSTYPDAFGLPKYKQACSDYGKAYSAAHTDDGLGLSYLVHQDDDFEEIHGHQPIIIADPGVHADNATAAQIANKNERKILFRLQQTGKPIVRAVSLNGLPQRFKDQIEVNHSMDHLELNDAFTQLERANTVKPSDIKWLQSRMARQWQRDVKIEAHTAQQLQSYTYLESAGQAPAPMEAVEMMWKSYTSTPADKLDFNGFMTNYLQQWPELDDQTPLNFAAAIIVYVNTLLPAEREANNVRRMAFAAQEVPATAPVQPAANAAAPVAAAVVQQQHHQHQHQPAGGRGAANGRGGGGGRGGRGGGGRGGGRGGRGPAAPPPRPYCHTHGGSVPGVVGHHSPGCWHPGPNHEWFATFDNQMGGMPAQ